MCGIIGYNGNLDQNHFLYGLKSLKYRGPDETGSYINKDKNLSLGINRLAINDVACGHQPMETHRSVVVYNGEIYNNKELRDELTQLDCKFKTKNSDTETLLHLYEYYNYKMVTKINGMWSFCIYDKIKNELFLSRDRVGKKPLFYYYDNKNFIFSSEIKGILSFKNINFEISPINLQKFSAYGFFPGKLTPYKNIYKLDPGHNLIFKIKEKKINIFRYWKYEIEVDHSKSEQYWCDALDQELNNATKIRSKSEVPWGIFLSGGLDSSLICNYASKFSNEKINSFSINFTNKELDETKWINHLVKKFELNHSNLNLNNDNFVDYFEKYKNVSDEPITDSSLVSYYALTSLAKGKIKFALGGDASDELLCGYDTFKAMKYIGFYNKFSSPLIHKGIKKMIKLIKLKSNHYDFRFKLNRFISVYKKQDNLYNPLWLSPVQSNTINEIFGMNTSIDEIYSEAINDWENSNLDNVIDKSLEFYFNFFLPNQILVKTDRLGMYNNIEVRSPFLDINVINIIRKIPNKFKLNGYKQKYILKKIAERYFDKKFIYRKKIGFSSPITDWISNNGKNYFLDNLNKIINKKAFEKKISSHFDKQENERLLIWNIKNLNNFLENKN